MSMFSLIFVLLLALAFIIFLLLFVEAEKRRTPSPQPYEQVSMPGFCLPPELRQAPGTAFPLLLHRPTASA